MWGGAVVKGVSESVLVGEVVKGEGEGEGVWGCSSEGSE